MKFNFKAAALKGLKRSPNNPKTISKMGYRDDSPYRNEPYLDIHTPNGQIDMSQTGIDLMANGRFLPAYSGMHQFDSNVVREVPLHQNGGPTPTYQDSLALYNYTQLQKKLENRSDMYKPSFWERVSGDHPRLNSQGTKDQSVLRAEVLKILKNNPNIKTGLYNVEKGLTRLGMSDYDAAEGSYDLYHPNIKPQKDWFGTAVNNDYSNVKPDPKIEIPYPNKSVGTGMTRTISKNVTLKPDPKIVSKQQQLIDAGYNIGTADGLWGPKSQAAWNKFQQQKEEERLAKERAQYLKETTPLTEESEEGGIKYETRGMQKTQTWVPNPNEPGGGHYEYGIPSENVPVENNAYQDGGDTDDVEESSLSNWWYNKDTFDKQYKMYNELDPWLSNWMSHPETKKRLQNSEIYYDTEGAEKARQKGLKRLNNLVVFDRSLYKNNGLSASDYEYNNKIRGFKNPSNLKVYKPDPTTRGSYYPSLHMVSLQNFNSPTTTAHEGVHGTGQYQTVNDIAMKLKFGHKLTPDAKEGYDNYKHNKDHIDYLDEDGLYPRIMEIRRQLNVKPGDIITKEQLENLKKKGPLFDLNKYYDDDQVLEILNTLADNNSKSNLRYAQDGGEIMELTDEEIEAYRAQGYEVDEIMQDAGQTPDDSDFQSRIMQLSPNQIQGIEAFKKREAEKKKSIIADLETTTANKPYVAQASSTAVQKPDVQINRDISPEEFTQIQAENKVRDAAIKKQQEEFEKAQWEKYDDASMLEAGLDRAKAFAVDPAGMTSRFLTGQQAYIPGMGDGLMNPDSPEYENYMKAIGRNPNEFNFAAEVQNLVNPGYWGASIGNNINKGNYGTAALEGAMTFAPFIPKGTGRNLVNSVKQGSRMLADDAARAGNYLTTQTPLKDTWKYNPYRFKPDPAKFYHRSKNYKDNIMGDRLVPWTQGNPELAESLRRGEPGKINLFKSKSTEDNLYFSKGVPLDRRYHTTGVAYEGPYVWEMPSSMKSINKVNGKQKPHSDRIGSYKVNTEPLYINDAKLYKEDWLRGYKEIPNPNTPSNKFKANATINDIVNQKSKTIKDNLKKIKNPLNNLFKPSPELKKTRDHFIDEVKGSVLNRSQNKKGLAEGNQWFRDWQTNPETAQRVKDNLTSGYKKELSDLSNKLKNDLPEIRLKDQANNNELLTRITTLDSRKNLIKEAEKGNLKNHLKQLSEEDPEGFGKAYHNLIDNIDEKAFLNGEGVKVFTEFEGPLFKREIKNLEIGQNKLKDKIKKAEEAADLMSTKEFTTNNYPLKQTIKDYYRILKYGEGELPLENASGISYLNDVHHSRNLPFEKHFEESGSWIQRKPIKNESGKISELDRSSIVTHENTHGWANDDYLKDSGDFYFIKDQIDENRLSAMKQEALNTNKNVKGLSDKIDEAFEYLTDPTEVHARIMQLRKEFGLKPGQMLDDNSAKDLYKKALKSKDVENYFVKMFTPENFKNLFNKLPAVAPVVGVGAAAASSMGDDSNVQPSMQTGGAVYKGDDVNQFRTAESKGDGTIYVSDPNDPRIQAYNYMQSLLEEPNVEAAKYRKASDEFRKYRKELEADTNMTRRERSNAEFDMYQKLNLRELDENARKEERSYDKRFEFRWHDWETNSDAEIYKPDTPFKTFPGVEPTYKKLRNQEGGGYYYPYYPKVKYADPEIVAKQQQLAEAGLYNGAFDGIWGPKSQAGWETLQQQNEEKRIAEEKAQYIKETTPLTEKSTEGGIEYETRSMGTTEVWNPETQSFDKKPIIKNIPVENTAYEKGGEFMEMELTDLEIAELKRQGYKIEDLP